METKDLYESLKSSSETQYAGFLIRFGAHIIDGFILSITANIIYWITGTNFDKGAMEIIYSPGGVLALLITVGYFVYFETSDKQATIGKSILGLKVIKQDGSKLTPADSIIRYIGKILSALIFFFGYIITIFDDKKRSLHDRIAGTYVIYSK